MSRRLILLATLVVMAEWAAFRVVHRDLLWVDAQAAGRPSGADVRASADSILDRAHPSRRHLEALIQVTDRDDLRDVRAAALARLAEREPDDPQTLLRLADALRQAGRYEEAAQTFARVAGTR